MTSFEKWIRKAAGSRGVTSPLYALFNTNTSLEHTKYITRWETLRGEEIALRWVELVWRDLHKVVHSLADHEADYKVLMD